MLVNAQPWWGLHRDEFAGFGDSEVPIRVRLGIAILAFRPFLFGLNIWKYLESRDGGTTRWSARN